MKISASFLSVNENLIDNIKKLDNSSVDFLHLDIMDGIFVNNKSWNYEFFKRILMDTKKPKDIHLMVSNVKEYIDLFKNFNPQYLTFHYEAINDVKSVCNYIKNLGIKVGLSIKPSTSIEEILPYLEYIDLILVMSVEPGKGGQKFIDSSVDKINQLYKLREKYNYNYVIEVDGGINDETSKLCNNADILVVGSYITNSNNYQEQINKIK